MIRKRYLRTNTIKTRLPIEFLSSANDKYITVRYCKALFSAGEQDYLVGNIMVHADFVQRDADLDHFICFANEYPDKYIAKFKFVGMTPDVFTVWFSDMLGNKVEHLMYLLFGLVTC